MFVYETGDGRYFWIVRAIPIDEIDIVTIFESLIYIFVLQINVVLNVGFISTKGLFP